MFFFDPQLQGGEPLAGGDTVAESQTAEVVGEQWDIVAEVARAEPTDVPQMSQQGGCICSSARSTTVSKHIRSTNFSSSNYPPVRR